MHWKEQFYQAFVNGLGHTTATVFLIGVLGGGLWLSANREAVYARKGRDEKSVQTGSSDTNYKNIFDRLSD